jgi:DNA-binding transcriptional ArsR family regulator
MPAGAEKFGSNHRERAGPHSAKPTFYRDMINRMTGGVPVIELFAREGEGVDPLPANFFTWGNQSTNSAEAAYEPAHDPASDMAPAATRAEILALLRRGLELTPDEIAAHLGLSVLSVRPRCTELVGKGLLLRTGHQRKSEGGVAAFVLRAVEVERV